MTATPVTGRQAHSNAYNIFILVLTVMSLAIMPLLLLPLSDATHETLNFYDNLICVVFLVDFAGNLLNSKPKRAYFIEQRGWLDLLGSIPSFGILRLTGLLRLARLSRLARITRLLRGENKKALVEDVVRNRGQYAIFITILLALLVLTTSSVLVLQFESTAPEGETPNILTGGDALWWAFVTITTVGYGDFFPVTTLGRLTGVFVMFAGVGIIGALASILASILVPPPESGDEESNAAASAAAPSEVVAGELANLRAEVAALRAAIEARQT